MNDNALPPMTDAPAVGHPFRMGACMLPPLVCRASRDCLRRRLSSLDRGGLASMRFKASLATHRNRVGVGRAPGHAHHDQRGENERRVAKCPLQAWESLAKCMRHPFRATVLSASRPRRVKQNEKTPPPVLIAEFPVSTTESVKISEPNPQPPLIA